MSGYMMSEIRAAVALHRDGVMIKDIAEGLGRSRHAVRAMLKYGGYTPRRGPLPLARTLERRANPIEICPSKFAMDQDAKTGSAMLLDAILKAGVRPS